ncbi:hypothetical protein BDV95DRAFT_609557 [Massariosphaeria phaeospora]|uniref:Uncharacterized protein n=1 Tax=Massariosphaeria phaeospora TaxID=100035 RepID=A0A7C8M8C4_9PLEO|nr:hypothetical protein BDV95DRAFT_609557 [Massariosphaeria phaeospora]
MPPKLRKQSCTHPMPSGLNLILERERKCPVCVIQHYLVEMQATQAGWAMRGGIYGSINKVRRERVDTLLESKQQKRHTAWKNKWRQAKIKVSNTVALLEDYVAGGGEVGYGIKGMEMALEALRLWEEVREDNTMPYLGDERNVYPSVEAESEEPVEQVQPTQGADQDTDETLMPAPNTGERAVPSVQNPVPNTTTPHIRSALRCSSSTAPSAPRPSVRFAEFATIRYEIDPDDTETHPGLVQYPHRVPDTTRNSKNALKILRRSDNEKYQPGTWASPPEHEKWDTSFFTRRWNGASVEEQDDDEVPTADDEIFDVDTIMRTVELGSDFRRESMQGKDDELHTGGGDINASTMIESVELGSRVRRESIQEEDGKFHTGDPGVEPHTMIKSAELDPDVRRDSIQEKFDAGEDDEERMSIQQDENVTS